MTRLVANDTNNDSPVMFALPNANFPIVLRQGWPAKSIALKEPRKDWRVERAIITSQGQIAYAGTGGFLSVQQPGKSPTPPRKMFPFPMTGIGFSTDGQWIAMADSSSNMRIQRTADLESNMAITRRLTQIASGFKLVFFLGTRRFQGEYPVRQWALSVPKDNEDGRRGIRAAALTESGRLLTWERPGPIGKQLSHLETRTVARDLPFDAITTNPRTQEVWASSYGLLGKVVFGEPPTFHECPGGIPAQTVSTMAWNEQGTLLALGLRSGEVRIVAGSDAPQCSVREIVVLPAHAGAVTTAVWRGDELATGSADGSARVWNLALNKEDESLFQELRALRTQRSLSNELVDRVLAKLQRQ